MIGCDNDCPYECFHAGCVKWYCADCVNQINYSYQVIEFK